MGAVFSILFLALIILSATKESKTTGLYKTFGVYGRFKAYLFLFLPMGIIAFVAAFFDDAMGFPGTYLLLAAFGALIYWSAYRKCPDFLKKKLFISMCISGLGVCIKIIFFFISAVWTLTGPQEMVDSSGNTVYYYSGNVYSSNGTLLGVANADRTGYVKTN